MGRYLMTHSLLASWLYTMKENPYASDYCAYCPKNMERRCNENCRTGIREWLNSPYIPSSDIWKEKR